MNIIWAKSHAINKIKQTILKVSETRAIETYEGFWMKFIDGTINHEFRLILGEREREREIERKGERGEKEKEEDRDRDRQREIEI